MITKDSAKDLLHVEEWLEVAREIVSKGRDAYDGSRVLQEAGDSVMMKIGEAANRLDRAGVLSDGVHWPHAIDNRNELLHRYDMINRDIAWNTLSASLPELGAALEELFAAAHQVVLLPGDGKATGPSRGVPGFSREI